MIVMNILPAKVNKFAHTTKHFPVFCGSPGFGCLRPGEMILLIILYKLTLNTRIFSGGCPLAANTRVLSRFVIY